MKKKLFAILILIFLAGDVFTLKLVLITNETAEIASWIEKYYLEENKYPEKIEEVLQKNYDCFGYNLYQYYTCLLEMNYNIFIENKNIVVINSKKSEKCVYDFEKKDFLYYEGQDLINTFSIPYFTNFKNTDS